MEIFEVKLGAMVQAVPAVTGKEMFETMLISEFQIAPAYFKIKLQGRRSVSN